MNNISEALIEYSKEVFPIGKVTAEHIVYDEELEDVVVAYQYEVNSLGGESMTLGFDEIEEGKEYALWTLRDENGRDDLWQFCHVVTLDDQWEASAVYERMVCNG